MSERLIIRLASQPNQPISWLVYSDKEREVLASGVLNSSDELEQITAQAANRVVDVLVPGQDVGYFEVTLPKANRRQAIKAVPYMLEDEIASPVESLHFVFAKMAGDRQGVYVCHQHKMEQWLAQLTTANITAKHLVADYLALPVPSEGAISILQFEQSLILRHGESRGVSVEQSWLGRALAENQSQEITLESFGVDVTFDDENITWQQQPSLVMPLQQLAMGCKKVTANMLSGQYMPTSNKQHSHWQVWRNAAVVAAVALTILFVDMYLAATQLEAQRAVVKKQSDAIYRQLNPGVKRVRMVKKQMTKQLAQFGQTDQGGEMLVMLAALNTAFEQVPELKPLTIKYDDKRSELRIQADAKTYQQFDKVKQILSTNYTVTPGAINNDGNKVNGSLTIKATS